MVDGMEAPLKTKTNIQQQPTKKTHNPNLKNDCVIQQSYSCII